MNPNWQTELENAQLKQMEDVADEAAARREAEKAVEQYLTRVESAKRIKARRRRIGQSGFSTRRMAIPSAKVAHPTRRSV